MQGSCTEAVVVPRTSEAVVGFLVFFYLLAHNLPQLPLHAVILIYLFIFQYSFAGGDVFPRVSTAEKYSSKGHRVPGCLTCTWM